MKANHNQWYRYHISSPYNNGSISSNSTIWHKVGHLKWALIQTGDEIHQSHVINLHQCSIKYNQIHIIISLPFFSKSHHKSNIELQTKQKHINFKWDETLNELFFSKRCHHHHNLSSPSRWCLHYHHLSLLPNTIKMLFTSRISVL